MSLKSAVGRARGLGSAKEGAGHFWAQRVSAIFLIPLSLWFAVSVMGLSHADYATFKGWMGKPGNATLMVMTVITVLYHAHLGLQIVIEDYVHCEAKKLVSLIAMKFAAVFLAVFMTVSILKVAIGA
ncbi:succinate dehydrogenase, hydrophobic membrane anchor protein [Paramagnetospirillum kuznetsovii]|uniref:Succinate dehydrogenase hydrophobic membrane anchor subunit n=1 Tax=Paramagnetospirillum kuznetsovii TaxID=2053833 RepID=A0A364P3Q4_9PROT|nr:succinate dehydrogenase, hydrophobic membrane anchor protein [Paramagnetospirillum kuznetsovii]RAU23926.1 succinate dehydrogenase, hydrophobic membrane anchor protein [Paramagnetospirillum kuznetsovii]